MGIFKTKKVMELVEQHFESVKEAVFTLKLFLEEYNESGASKSTMDLCSRINDYEHEADSLRREIVAEFLRGSMLPQTRRELLRLVEMVDRMANISQDVSRDMLIEKPKFEKECVKAFNLIIKITCEQIELLSEAISALFADYEKLVGEGKLLEEINQLEHEIDTIELELLKCIFDKELPLAEKFQRRFFVEKIAGISDLVENISDEIQIMVVFRKI